jgi:hypothetical protein
MRHRKVTTKPKLRNAQDDTIKLKRACSMLCHKIGKRKWKKLRRWKNEEYQLWKSNAKNCWGKGERIIVHMVYNWMWYPFKPFIKLVHYTLPISLMHRLSKMLSILILNFRNNLCRKKNKIPFSSRNFLGGRGGIFSSNHPYWKKIPHHRTPKQEDNPPQIPTYIQLTSLKCL